MMYNKVETFYCFEAITSNNSKIRFTLSKEEYNYLNGLTNDNDKLDYLNGLYERLNNKFIEFIRSFESNNGDILIGCIEVVGGKIPIPMIF